MWDLIVLNPMVNTLLWIYSLLGNFGVAIILFTIVVRMITYPLTAQQMKSAQVMQDMQKSKEWQEIQKKHKDNKQKLQQEQMKLYQEKGVNPLGSCLPLVIQIPIIFGLYQAITRALATTPLRMVDLFNHVYPFMNIAAKFPLNNRFLYMDLSQPERLMILGYGIPLLAIVVGVTTYFQSKLMTPTAQPGEQGAQMTQAMNLYMPFLMGYLAFTFPSGLSLYFVVSNLVSVLQYALMGKLSWSNLLPARKSSAR
jgi:YidC/Oxa1 family membrane protein insertase